MMAEFVLRGMNFIVALRSDVNVCVHTFTVDEGRIYAESVPYLFRRFLQMNLTYTVLKQFSEYTKVFLHTLEGLTSSTYKTFVI